MPVKEVGALAGAFFQEPPVAEVGRVAERSRCRRMPSARIGARVHSLSLYGLAEATSLDAISIEKAEVPRSMLDFFRCEKLVTENDSILSISACLKAEHL